MWSNHPALKVKNILTIFINSISRSMCLSKHQEHGMNDLWTFLLKKIRMGKADSTPFTRKMDNDLFVCQIYFDDIIFGSTKKSFVMSLAK
jgi:hypothetical protein